MIYILDKTTQNWRREKPIIFRYLLGYNPGHKRGRRVSSLKFQRLRLLDQFESHVLRQMHRGMLYEPLSSIAAPFFVAITGIQAYRTIPPMLTKTQKYEKKHQRYGIWTPWTVTSKLISVEIWMIFSFNLVRSFVIQPFMKSLFIIELNIACNAFFHLSFRPVADSIKLFFF